WCCAATSCPPWPWPPFWRRAQQQGCTAQACSPSSARLRCGSCLAFGPPPWPACWPL
ncbi:hypothetical protein HaLaN_16017, partial [Haematococcus lacustris]